MPDPRRPCFAHLLHTCLMYALGVSGPEKEQLSEIQVLLGKCRRLVSFVHSSTKVSTNLRQAAADKGTKWKELAHDVPTHWNSTLTMLKSLLHCNGVLQDILGADEANSELLLSAAETHEL